MQRSGVRSPRRPPNSLRKEVAVGGLFARTDLPVPPDIRLQIRHSRSRSGGPGTHEWLGSDPAGQRDAIMFSHNYSARPGLSCASPYWHGTCISRLQWFIRLPGVPQAAALAWRVQSTIRQHDCGFDHVEFDQLLPFGTSRLSGPLRTRRDFPGLPSLWETVHGMGTAGTSADGRPRAGARHERTAPRAVTRT